MVKAKSFSLVVTPLVETLPMMSINILETLEDQGHVLAQKELRELRRMQRSDSLLERWRVSVIDQAVPQTHLAKADVKGEILSRKVLNGDEKIQQLLLLECYHQDILRGRHDNMGHLGVDSTID